MVTTDGAANMEKAMSELSEATILWVKCILHCLHNSVLKGVEEIQDDKFKGIEKIKRLVTYIR